MRRLCSGRRVPRGFWRSPGGPGSAGRSLAWARVRGGAGSSGRPARSQPWPWCSRLVAALPLTRDAFRDSRYHLDTGHTLLTAFVLIPLGTVLLRRSPSAVCSGPCCDDGAGRGRPRPSRRRCSVCGTCSLHSAWPATTRRSGARSGRDRSGQAVSVLGTVPSPAWRAWCSASCGGAAAACWLRPACTGRRTGWASWRRRPCGRGRTR